MEFEVPKLEELTLTEINGQPCMPGAETNLAELLLTAAQSRPQGQCLETEGTCYTFAQVVQMTNSICKALREALLSLQLPAAKEGHQPEAFQRRLDEHVVTIVLNRGVQSIASVHAVMLERCCYNTFDVGEPLAKLKTWMEVSRPPVMISSAENLKRLGVSDVSKDLGEFLRKVVDVHSVDSMDLSPTVAKCSPEDLDRLAYLTFNSGSTGKPKAVMIRHQSALNMVRLWTKWVGLTAKDRFAQVASMSGDVHVIEVFGTLAAGATSVTCADLVKKSGPDMLQWLKKQRITGMRAVPSQLRSMAQGDVSRSSLPQLRLLDVGGKALGLDVVETWATERKLFHSYGPLALTYVEAGHVITMGAPLPTYRCHILDPETFTPVAPGTRGVLFVGGISLARGYLEEEEETKAKFLDHPKLGRIYNTGDLAACDERGCIHLQATQNEGIEREAANQAEDDLLEALHEAIKAVSLPQGDKGSPQHAVHRAPPAPAPPAPPELNGEAPEKIERKGADLLAKLAVAGAPSSGSGAALSSGSGAALALSAQQLAQASLCAQLKVCEETLSREEHRPFASPMRGTHRPDGLNRGDPSAEGSRGRR